MKLPRSFAWLNVAQFFGSLNDNIFKFLIVFFLIQSREDAPAVLAMVGAVFVLPFILFSHLGGVLADRKSKRSVIVATKIAEVVVMGLGLIAFLTKSVPALYVTCFLMSTQSALFGPSKFGIIPELVPAEALTKANGILVALTFLAVVVGQPVAAALSEIWHNTLVIPAAFCLGIAVMGALAALLVRHTRETPRKTDSSPIRFHELRATLRAVKRDSYLLLTIVSSAYFLLVATYIRLNLIPYGMELGMTEERSSYLFLVAALGIGASAMLVGKVSGRNIEFGLVPLGALGLTAACALLYTVRSLDAVVLVCFLAGVSVGFFIVPLDTFLQVRSPRRKVGRILAASAFAGYLGVLLATGYFFFTSNVVKLSASEGFAAIGSLNLVLAVGAVLVLPDFFVRFLIAVVTRIFYRITTIGDENLPTNGGALLASNHVTMADALLIAATQQRRICFVMYRGTYEKCWWFRPIFRLMRVIPISPEDPPRALVTSLKRARQMLDDGYLVGIFPEGYLTRNGNMAEFKTGMERILKGSNHPVIPIHIGGGWGSIFSHRHGRPMTSLPKRIPYPITVMYGRPMASNSSAHDVRRAITELSSEWFELRKHKRTSLGRLFVRCARENWFRQALADTTGKSLKYGKALISATVVAGQLKKICRDEKQVGVILPATAGGCLTNIALTMLGKVAVNLNFTAPAEAVASAIDQCQLTTFLSSRKFAQKVKDFEMPKGTVFLEDLLPKVTGKDKIVALLKALFLPARLLVNERGFTPDSLATIIFSSGSTGEPKGVMLSHHNVISNMEAFGMVFQFERGDNMCAALPFFHSFGFTCSLWFPLVTGFSVTYHPNPLDGDVIARVVREHKSTILLATPTFLLAYVRRASFEDFATLRFVITGAEKLRERIATAFEKKFRIAPLEGYGVTETAPAVAANLPNTDIDGICQPGTRKGTIGQPIPGVAVKIVGPEDDSPLPVGQEGMLMIKGPNVMLGYLGNSEKTAEVIRDGWYETGDIARVDQGDFITITDRASRFSKIGGEMVPHIAVEDVYLESLNTDGRVVVVTGVPDERRGERLVVIHTDEAGPAESLHAIIEKSHLPNLWRPRLEDYVKLDAIPVLGSGKLDLKKVKQLALDLAV